MRKIRESPRLHLGEDVSRRPAAVAAGMPCATTADHLAFARRAGLGWPLPEEVDGVWLGVDPRPLRSPSGA